MHEHLHNFVTELLAERAPAGVAATVLCPDSCSVLQIWKNVDHVLSLNAL